MITFTDGFEPDTLLNSAFVSLRLLCDQIYWNAGDFSSVDRLPFSSNPQVAENM